MMRDPDSRLRASAPGATGRHRNIYVAESDRDVWDAAAKRAGERGISLASLVAAALAKYLGETA